MEEIKNSAVKFNRARNNLLLVVVFTMINLVLIALEMDLSFLFSAIVPQIILFFSIDMSLSLPFAMTVAILCLSFYVLCFALSKRYRVFILIAFLAFATDTAILLYFALISGVGDFIFDIAFHAWIHFYLITGIIAWAKLRNVSREEFKAVIESVAAEEEKEELNSALDTVAPDDEKDKS